MTSFVPGRSQTALSASRVSEDILLFDWLELTLEQVALALEKPHLGGLDSRSSASAATRNDFTDRKTNESRNSQLR